MVASWARSLGRVCARKIVREMTVMGHACRLEICDNVTCFTPGIVLLAAL